MIPEFPKFKKLELSDKTDIENFTHSHLPYSDFNFTSMWVWNTADDIQISILNNNLVVRFKEYLTSEYFYSFLGTENIKDTAHKLIEHAKNNNIKAELKLIPYYIEKDSFETKEDQDNFDYVYEIEELYKCTGGKYETIRNLINRFKKRDTNHRLHNTDSTDETKEYILDLNKTWIENKNNKVEKSHSEKETCAIERLFDIKDNTNLCATCVFKEEKLVSFIINELIPDSEYAIAHFAKADSSLPGIYAYTINENCKYLLSKGRKYLNYEQDMGLLNLRHAKLSLNPKHYLKKHIVRKTI